MTEESKKVEQSEIPTDVENETKKEKVEEKPTAEPKTEEPVVKETKTEEPEEKPAEEPKVEEVKTETKPEKKPAEEVKEEVKVEPKKEEPKPEPTGKFKDLIKEIEELSVLELAELVKELENRFGVSAVAPVAAATSGNASQEENQEEEKTEFNIILKSAGQQKINVIKAVREITQLGLKDAKDLVDGAPKEVKNNVKKEEAEEIKKKLEAVGAEVELK